ncbi:MAG: efflux RND transporter permease subunit [Terrimicrobiaceae bacterium]|nr:efflux RND transporter permease subunit [Terrimicrobiaceae bacterium]
MNVSAPFIRRPIATSLLAIGLFLLGVAAYFSLPIAPLPRVDFPTISVGATLPGVDPATAASSLAAPLERRLGKIPGVIEMTSSSSVGGASVTVQFDLNRDINGAARDVQAAINAAARDLPADLPNPPTYRKLNPADAPVMVLAMTSATRPLSEVYNFAEQIVAQRLSQVPGVSQVYVFGGAKSAVRVQADPAALAAMGLSIEDIRNFLGQTNRMLPKGGLQSGGKNYMVAADDQLVGAAAYRPLVVTERNGTAVQLDSIAKVIDGPENTRQAGWFNTERAVILPVMKQPDANVIEVVDAVRKLLPQLGAWLPPGVQLSVLSDRTQTIRASVSDVQFTLALTIALVIVVMFLVLRRFWPTFIIGVTVPLALAGTFGVMWLCGFSLDNISLMALTVSIGFLVDDSIVVIENIVRHIEEGVPPLEAALAGTRQIAFTVISISLSLVAVFIPILLMGGIIGRLFQEFAVTLCAAIIVSAVVSLTLTATLCGHFMRRQAGDADTRRGAQFFGPLQRGYERGLRRVLGHRRAVQVLALAILVATVWLYVVVPKGFFPQQDTGLMMGQVEAAQDISFSAMLKKQEEVVRILLADPAIENVGSFLGSGGGGPSNSGRMFITLKPRPERKESADNVIVRLRRQFARLEGVGVFLQSVQDIRAGGRMGKAQFQYALQDSDLQGLNTWAPKLVEALQKLPQLKDVNSDQQFQGLQTTVVVDRDAAGRLGIQPDAVDSTLYSAFGQRQVSIMYRSQNQYRVILEASPAFQEDPDYLKKIYVRTAAGQMIPLSSIAHFESTNTPLAVNHQGQFPCSTITFNLAPGISLGEATQLILQTERDLHMPATVRGGFAGNAQVFRDSLSSQPLLILAALVAVYLVLGILYESLIHPLTILSTLPSAGLGALLALRAFELDLSIVAMIGILLLIGIVKKNAILMVDFAIAGQRDRGLSPEAAIYEACLVRFRPILMTTAAAIAGSLPLALGSGVGSELRQPLGIAIVGGLLVSQALTLFTTPVTYLAMERLRSWLGRSKRGTSRRGAPLAGIEAGLNPARSA